MGLAWTLGYNLFARVCAILRGTCHVQPIGLKLPPSSFHWSGTSNKYSPVPIGPAVRATEAKMLRQTDIQTNTGLTTFFQRPTRGNPRAKAFNAKASKPFYFLNLNLIWIWFENFDFELEAGIACNIALCQNRRFISLPLHASGGIRTHDHTIIYKTVSPPSFRAERCLSRPNQTLCSCTKTEILKSLFTCLIHVWKGRNRWPPQLIKPTNGDYQPTKFEPNAPLVWSAPLATTFFVKVCALAHGTWHVQPISLKPILSSFRLSDASNEYSSVPIRPAARVPEANVFGQTDRHTY